MYLEPLPGGSGDSVSRLIMGMTRLTRGIMWIIEDVLTYVLSPLTLQEGHTDFEKMRNFNTVGRSID